MNYWKQILLLKSVAEAYEAEKGTGKPLYLSRRFVGAVLALVAGYIACKKGITIDATAVQTLSDNVVAIIGGCISAYGIVMHVVGQVQKGGTNGQGTITGTVGKPSPGKPLGPPRGSGGIVSGGGSGTGVATPTPTGYGTDSIAGPTERDEREGTPTA